MRSWFWCFSAAALLATDPILQAAGLIVISDPGAITDGRILPGPLPMPLPHPRPTPPPERHFVWAPLEVTSLQVRTQIKDQYATTSIDEEFYNPNARPLEGTFLFPLPKGAHLSKFSMEIGGKPVEAELLDSEKARRLYEEIVRKAKDPALLEYAGRDLLKARIFPIEPNSRKRVTVAYAELLKSDAGLVNYSLPLDSGKFSISPVKSVSVKVDLETKRPLKSIYSPSHTVEIRRHGSDRATIGFEASSLRPESDFQLFFAAEPDELGFSLLTHRVSDEEGYFLLLASPGQESKSHKILPKDVAFVLDTSGSMAGAKLDQAKKALLFCVENLNENDRFEVMRFATEAEPLFGRLLDNSPQNRARATDFIKALKPIGGTAIDEALHKALDLRTGQSDRPFVIVFLTDGRPTVGLTDENQIVANVSSSGADRTNTRIFCFGIGTDVNTHLLDRITEETHAFSQYVLPEEDIEVKVSSFFAKIKEPVLANLRLRTGHSVRFSKMYPSDLPDLFQGEQLILLGRYSGTGDHRLVLEGVVDLEKKQFSYQAVFPEKAADYGFIPRLWATRRVGYLIDQIRLHGENQELRQEATDLARQYGLVTPYTAHLILEDEARRGVPLTAQSLQAFQQDLPAQAVARQFYSSANNDRSGQVAVSSARFGMLLKQADNAQALSLSRSESERALFPSLASPVPTASSPMLATTTTATGRSSSSDSAARLTRYAQQSRFVNGRNFFLNGQQWIDATVQRQTNAPRVLIQFNSPEYFALAQSQPIAAPWLALGQNVQFLLGGKRYEITDSAADTADRP
jgi:Ca-activated chloride channel homolog